MGLRKWKHNSLVHHATSRLNPAYHSMEGNTVSTQVYKHKIGWNKNKIKTMFHSDDGEDHLLWNKSKTGLLTVKAVANHLLFQSDLTREQTQPPPLNNEGANFPLNQDYSFWGRRLFKNSFPIGDNLAKKHINPVPPCPLCVHFAGRVSNQSTKSF